MPRSPIFSILQTKTGYIWLGTLDGLICFDGVRFHVFNTRTVKALHHNCARALYEDRKERLWIGSENAVICLDNGQFKEYALAEEGSLPRGNVSCIMEDRRQNLWIGTLGRGVYCLSMKDPGLRPVTYTTKEGLSSNEINDIIEDSNGDLWFATLDGLQVLRNGKFHFLPVNNSIHGIEIYTLKEDQEKNLWIGTDKGLSKWTRSTPGAEPAWATIFQCTVGDIFQDRCGSLWVGTDGGGLFRLVGDRVSSLNADRGLSDNYIRSIYEDREGNLWVGTSFGSLNRLKDSNFITYSSREGLSMDMTWCVSEDRQGNIWIGTENGLNVLANETLTSFHVTDGLSGNKILSMCEDPEGNLWVGTDKGLDCLARTPGGSFKVKPTHISKNLRGRNVSCLYNDPAGNVWVGLAPGGLFRIEGKSLVSAMITGASIRTPITNMLRSRTGHLWVGTRRSGLYRVDPALSCENCSVAHPQALHHVLCLHEDESGALWIGTKYGGLNRYKAGKFFSFSQSGGFFNFEVNRILDDGRGYFWITSNRGIYRVKKTDLNHFAEKKIKSITPTVYNENDGMLNRICNGSHQPAGWKGKDGKLWFPTTIGVTMIDLSRMRQDQTPPSVIIEEVFVDNMNMKPFFDRVPCGGMVFDAGKKNLEFHYTGLSYRLPQNVKFKYKLEGYDKEWHMAESRRAAYYTNIPAGKYIFRVTACNNEGVWSAGEQFHFRIRSYLYETLWFYLVCAVMVFGIVRGIIRHRIKQLKRNKVELERVVEERTHALEGAIKELNRIATIDGMTGIYNYRWFSTNLDREWKRALRMGRPIGILLIDVDFFKAYNDAYGHQAGDECLRKVASELRTHCRRPADAVARYGGEEFIVILPETDTQHAGMVAGMMREGVENLAIPHQVSSVAPVVTISIGYASLVPHETLDAAALVKMADDALYHSKKNGRNRISVW
ncbi:MAG: two-component regulator propeller domain-containing protein [Candidatus Omnitrophota bacterium]